MKKALIIQTAFIGDVVLATSLVESLKKIENYQIDFLLRKGNEGLMQNNPAINNLFIWDKKNGKYKSLLRLLKTIRKQKYDRIINLQRYSSTGFLTAFSRAKEKFGYDKNPFSFFFSKKFPHKIDPFIEMHEVERNHQFIYDLCGAKVEKPCLYPANADFEDVQKYKTSDYVCIAPASVWFTKQFPKQKWIEFINSLPKVMIVNLLGGPDDKDLCEEIHLKCKDRIVNNTAGKLSFLQSAALMKDAKMNFVNDSAPMHIASAMNAPTTAIFQSTIPEFGFGPLADKSFVVEINEKLECRPCGIVGKTNCPKGHFYCANNIKNEDLIMVLKD